VKVLFSSVLVTCLIMVLMFGLQAWGSKKEDECKRRGGTYVSGHCLSVKEIELP